MTTIHEEGPWRDLLPIQKIDVVRDLTRAGYTYGQIAERYSTTVRAVRGAAERMRRADSDPDYAARIAVCTRGHSEKADAKDKPALMMAAPMPSRLEIDGWIKRHGVRRFESGASSDYLLLKQYLEQRGYDLSMRQSQYIMRKANGRGRPRIIGHGELFDLVDGFRVAEGLEPFRRQPERESA